MKRSLSLFILPIILLLSQNCSYPLEDPDSQLKIVISADDKISITDKEISLDDLRVELRAFLNNENEGQTIKVEYRKDTSYETFVSVLDTVYEEWTSFRDQISNRKFGEDYDKLTNEQSAEIKSIIPEIIGDQKNF